MYSSRSCWDLRDPTTQSTTHNSPAMEALDLPKTKLEKKREKLVKMYERAAEKHNRQRPSTSHPGVRRLRIDENIDVDEEIRRKSDNQVVTSYERNRLNNMKSHIALPTYSSVSSVSSMANGNDKEIINCNGDKDVNSKEVQTDLEVTKIVHENGKK